MDEITDLLTRGVSEIVVKEHFEQLLKSGKKLRVKHGVDPTTSDLHLGYSVIYRKLKKFQELGHTVVFLIGSFTARFGDPTDKSQARTMRTKKEVEAVAKDYIKQLSKILDIKKLEVVYNGDWFDKMSAEDLLHLMSEFTVARMLERDMFQQRIKEGSEIGLHEPVYPLLQGYDSVMIRSDLTVIGNDQKFNELQARPLQKARGQAPQDVMIMPLLVGTDGKRKMSQSLGNYIGLTEPPSEQFGKIMSLPDEQIVTYFELTTEIPLTEIEKMRAEMRRGANPKEYKMRLGREIVSLYHGEKAAREAEQNFISMFQKKELPSEIEVKKMRAGEWSLADLLVESGLADSKNEARRLIEQGGVRVNEKKIAETSAKIEIRKNSTLIQGGKRRFMKIIGK